VLLVQEHTAVLDRLNPRDMLKHIQVQNLTETSPDNLSKLSIKPTGLQGKNNAIKKFI
jgi:hypothetical protein